MYEAKRELAQLSMKSWTSNEVFSFGWFFMVGILVVCYAVWLKLLDKKRATGLLLIGSLMAVGKIMISGLLIDNILGLYNYNIRLLPVPGNVFASSVTLSPILVMLVTQYTSSWKGYIIWVAIGYAFLNFVLFPIYTAIGILEFHNWNVFYHFLIFNAVGIVVRVVFLSITGIQKRHTNTAT